VECMYSSMMQLHKIQPNTTHVPKYFIRRSVIKDAYKNKMLCYFLFVTATDNVKEGILMLSFLFVFQNFFLSKTFIRIVKYAFVN